MTNSDVIREALIILGVLAETDALSAEQGADGLSVMNDMLMAWDADGIDTGYYPQTDLNVDSPIYPDAMLAAKYNLALNLSYGIDPQARVIAIADRTYKRLLRDAMIAQMKEADMSHLHGLQARANILEG